MVKCLKDLSFPHMLSSWVPSRFQQVLRKMQTCKELIVENPHQTHQCQHPFEHRSRLQQRVGGVFLYKGKNWDKIEAASRHLQKMGFVLGEQEQQESMSLKSR